VTVHYDPMLAKLIAWGRAREESIARMNWALEHFAIVGVTTNIEFLRRVITHPEFRAGRIHTQFLDEHEITMPAENGILDEALLAAALVSRNGLSASRGTDRHDEPPANPWFGAGPWRAL
jgi:3-methylcrotonyl-CoA carboxylase alpha subunit